MVKLHIGCGSFYKVGYVNIDFYDNTIADIVMPADELSYTSSSVDTIEAYHVIEHFDYTKILYVLSEWFRVLKPEGILVIETPDLEESFKDYVKGSIIERKSMITWIFGTDAPGMRHKCGFSFDVIEEILRKVGFANISKEKQKTHAYARGMRIICKKSSCGFEKYQILTLFRKRLKKETQEFIDTPELLIDFEENCIEKLNAILFEFLKTKNKKYLDQMLVEISPYCPTAVRTLLELMHDSKITSAIETHVDIARYLEGICFSGKLFSLWEKMEKPLGKEKETFMKLIMLARLSLKKLLSFPSSESVRKKFEKIEGKKIKYISRYSIQVESDRLFRLAVKDFANNRLENARRLLCRALRLTPDNFLLHWNLARIYAREEERQQSMKFYSNALDMVKEARFKQILMKEIQNSSEKKSRAELPVDEQTLGM